MSEIDKYRKYLKFKANPRFLRRDFIVPLYTGTEPDIVPETGVEELETVQEFEDGGFVYSSARPGIAGQVLALPKKMQKVFKSRYPDKEWKDLTKKQRNQFKQDFLRQQKILKSIPKDYITINKLAEKLGVSDAKSLREKRTYLGKFINEKLKPMTFGSIQGGTTERGTKVGGSVKYYKNPSPRLLNKILEMKETSSQVDVLRDKTVKNVNKLYDDYLDIYKKGKLPLIEEIKNMTPGEAGIATTRLAQILDGKKFRNEGLENIRINKNVASKIFEELNKHPFGNPYRSYLYKIALETIDQKLGNKKGTFNSLKKEAVQILKDAKIPIYNMQSKNPKGFNINEIAGVSGSARSKAAEFSQFIDIMEGELNQKQLVSFQSALSRARANIEENPATFNKKMKYINALASSLEEEYKVKLPRIRPATQVGRYYNQERLAELNKLGLDIKAASERAGYTIQMPKGAVTIQEFINNPEIRDQMIANIGCPTLVSKSIGGRVNFSNGSSCYMKGLEKIQSGKLNQVEKKIAKDFFEKSGVASDDIKNIFKTSKGPSTFLLNALDTLVGITRPAIIANIGLTTAVEGENILRGQLNPGSALLESFTFGAAKGGPTKIRDQLFELGSSGTTKVLNYLDTIKKFNDEIKLENKAIENAKFTFAEYGIDPTNEVLKREQNIKNIQKLKNEFELNPSYTVTEKDKNDFRNDVLKFFGEAFDKSLEGTKKTSRFSEQIKSKPDKVLMDPERFPNIFTRLYREYEGADTLLSEIRDLKDFFNMEKEILDESQFLIKNKNLLDVTEVAEGLKGIGKIENEKLQSPLKPQPPSEEERISIEERGAREID